MPAAHGELRIPTALRGHVGEILAITDRVCLEHLDAEYAELCRRLVAKLARKRPSPLERRAAHLGSRSHLRAGIQQLPVRSQRGSAPNGRPPERAARSAARPRRSTLGSRRDSLRVASLFG
jgi:hypothetical protein